MSDVQVDIDLVRPHAYFLDPICVEDGLTLLEKIETLARISHRSEDSQSHHTWRKFIEKVVLLHGDWSVVEHVTATVIFVTDRGITHEIVRHRLGSYTQESTRFVRYGKKHKLTFIIPDGLSEEEITDSVDLMHICAIQYNKNLDNGMAPQIARSFLPMALASKLAVTFNLRMWRHFLLMRTTKETHPEMRRIIIPLLAKFKEFIPLLYDDIVPEARQRDNMRMMR